MSRSSTPSIPLAGSALRQRTAFGVMWVVLQGLASRGIVIVMQLALAWLLSKSDFGLIGLAYTVTGFINLLSNPGIDGVLVQRRRRFHLWATPAFWMGMTTGVLGMLTTMAAAPIAAWAYDKPALIGVLMVLATAMPLQTLQIVPKAHLQAQLQFRAVMLLGLLGNALTAVFTILFAWLGFGAYSFAIPLPITAAAVAAATWWVSHPPVRLRPEFHCWKYLLGDSLHLAGTRVMFAVILQGEFIVLGLARFPDAAIGTFVFAYNVSVQAFRIIAGSLQVVLFPSLSHISLNPELQVRSTVRAARLLSLVTVPFCALQILLAGPVFRLAFPDRWLDAILPMQILTLGAMVNAPCWPATSLLMAQRRFREYFRVAVWYGLSFFALVSAAVVIHRSIEAVAIGMLVWSIGASAYMFWAAVRPQLPFRTYYAEIYPSFLAGLGAAIPGVILMSQMPMGIVPDLAAIGAVTVLYSAVYLLLLRSFAAADLADALKQLAPMLSKLGLRLPPGFGIGGNRTT